MFVTSDGQRLQWSIQSLGLHFILFSVPDFHSQALSLMKTTQTNMTCTPSHPQARLQWMQFCSPPADDRFFSPADRSVWVLHEFPFLFIALWCPAAPVNTFLQPAIHRNILAAETPVMNFNLPFAEGASPWVRLIKGNTPLPRGRASTDRLSPSYPIITLPLPLCCKLLRMNPVRRGARTLRITFQSV